MDFEGGESGRERHFVLHVMSFVYGLYGKPLQYCLQEMLDKYPRENEKYCTKSITQALLLYISDYLGSNVTLVDLASQAYQVQTEELLDMYVPYNFLRFLAHYAVKSKSEYYDKKLLDSPMKFFSSMVRFLEAVRKNGKYNVEFWERLDEAAAEVAAKGLETIKSRDSKPIDVGDYVDGTSEREFILMIMKTISKLYSNPLPEYLIRELDEFMMISQYDFHPNFEIALSIAAENLERSVADLGNDEVIYDYYYHLSTKSFSARYFLEFCVCCTRKALLEYYINMNEQSPLRACNRLSLILQHAKQDGKFYSVDSFIEGANEIIEGEKIKAELKGVASDASTEFYSDISTESTGPISDRENMFESFENSLPTANVTVTRKNAQPSIDRVIAPVKDALPDIKSAITTSENAQPNSANGIATGDNAQPNSENGIATGDNAQPNSENGIATGDNAQPNSENGIATGDNAQPNSENLIASCVRAESGESEDLVAPSEQATRGSCNCCTTL